MRQILISLLLPALALAVPAASMSSTAMSKTSSMASMSKTSMTAATMMTKAVSTSSMSKTMSSAKTSMSSKTSMTSKTTSMAKTSTMMAKTSTKTSMMAMPTAMNLNTMLGNKCARMTVLQIIIAIIIPSNTGSMPATQQTMMKNMTTMATNKLNMMMANSTFAMTCQCKQIPMLQQWSTMMNNPANIAIIVETIVIRLPTMMKTMAKPMTTIVITNIVVIINNMLNTMMKNTNLMNFCNMKATTPTNNGTVLLPTTSVKPVTTATATTKPAMVTTNAAVRAMDAMGPGAFAGIFMLASFFFF